MKFFTQLTKKIATPTLLACTLLVLPTGEAVASQNKPKTDQPKKAIKKENSKKETQKKSSQKKESSKKDSKTNKKTDNKNTKSTKSSKKSGTQPSTDGKGVIPINAHDPNGRTLLEGQEPTEEELSLANKTLLAKNAELERQINILTNQNNVLTQERSGQLFMYGTMTAIFSVILGAILVKLFGNRKERW